MSDLSDCRRKLRSGSRSFYAASLVLPRHVREPATALYAFCRVADDAIDCASAADDAVASLQRRLSLIYAGCPDDDTVDRAFALTVARHSIPKAIPDALLEGFAWDAAGRRYEDLSELVAYAARVAGSVGVMMALVMGASSEAALARACDLGVAMQLSNIARDIGEDARAGRLYLPLSWFRQAGLDPQSWLDQPIFDAKIGTIVARLLEYAGDLYQRAEIGIQALPWACRPGIRAASLIYAEIGAEVARAGYDSVSRRAIVSTGRKLALVLKSMLPGRIDVTRNSQSPLPETRFLIDAIEPRLLFGARKPAIVWWDLDARIGSFFQLLMRLERAEQVSRGRL